MHLKIENQLRDSALRFNYINLDFANSFNKKKQLISYKYVWNVTQIPSNRFKPTFNVNIMKTWILLISTSLEISSVTNLLKIVTSETLPS